MKNIVKQFVKFNIAKKNCTKRDKGYETFKMLIEQVDVVSFDMFDTLVKRNVQNPYHIFQIVETEARKKYNFTFDFPAIRKSAELEIYQQGEKITLQTIYNQIEKLGINHSLCEWLMEKELEIEEKFIVVNELGKTLYDICKQKNKKLVVTSDMYLSKDFLSKILDAMGYCIDEIFISGEYGCSKSSGGLYDAIKNELGTSNILHIGDNFHADFMQARRHGFKSYWVVVNKKHNCMSLNDSIFLSLINRRYDSEIEKFGYSVFGPFLYNFCLWIHEQCSNLGRKIPLLFLSRDGYVYYNAYKKMFPEDNASYVRMSRKTAVLSKFAENTDLEFVLNSYSVGKTISIREFLHCLNLDNGEVHFKQDVDIKKIWKVKEFLQSDVIKKIYTNEILPVLKIKALDIQEKLKKYLDKYISNENTIVIVDDGWRGNIQKALEFNYPERNFIGYYVGIENKDLNKFGYAFDPKKSFMNFYKLAPAMGFFETICAENCGSLLDYKYVKEEVEPVLSPYSIQQQKSGELADSIQKYAIQFIEDLIFYSITKTPLSGCIQKFLQYMENPPVKFLKELVALCHDDVGVNQIVNYDKSRSLIERLKMSKKSEWKYASMKLNFIDINYARILLPIRVIKRKLSRRR